MKFLHVMIRVKDINKSLKFYQELFDMNLVNEMELEDSKLYFLSDEDGQTQIELTHNFNTPKDGYKNGEAFGHFAFSTRNMEDFENKMKEFGINWLVEPFVLENYDMKIAFLKDPDGNEIELIEQ
ncbi:MAG: VOC family protein [Candidatus Gastranaerophilales bacterium]|nr:VOC family protein [Candidatus Gastranaerophilales bacterium]